MNSESELEEHFQRLPGVDYKNRVEPTYLKRQVIHRGASHGEVHFPRYVGKELCKKSNIRKIQNAFQEILRGECFTPLAVKSVSCTAEDISIKLDCLLTGISAKPYIEKWQNSDLIEEPEPVPEPLASSTKTEILPVTVKPSVIAVNLKWTNGIETWIDYGAVGLTQPLMRKTKFLLQSKTKFCQEIEAVCEELFPDTRQRLVIHGHDVTSNVIVSDRLIEDPVTLTPFTGKLGDPHTRKWREFTDLREHKILLVPHHSSSKNGFHLEVDSIKPISKYPFPLQVKFLIGRRIFQHKVVLNLRLSKSPQHYGLIFTFPEDSKGHSKIRIKSLITVYSVYPKSSKVAILESYETETESLESDSDSEDFQYDDFQSLSPAKTYFTKVALNTVQVLMENLTSDKLVRSFTPKGFTISREFNYTGQCVAYCSGKDTWDKSIKLKKKRQIYRDIREFNPELINFDVRKDFATDAALVDVPIDNINYRPFKCQLWS